MSFICLLNGRKEAKNDSWLETSFLASPLPPHLCLYPCSTPQNLIFGVFPFIPGALGLGLRLRVHLLGSAEAVGVGGQPGAALFFSFCNAPSSIYSEPTTGQPATRCSPWGHARTPAVPGGRRTPALYYQLGACPKDIGSTGGAISAFAASSLEE